jgi:hypothetical protein
MSPVIGAPARSAPHAGDGHAMVRRRVAVSG